MPKDKEVEYRIKTVKKDVKSYTVCDFIEELKLNKILKQDVVIRITLSVIHYPVTVCYRSPNEIWVSFFDPGGSEDIRFNSTREVLAWLVSNNR